MECVCLFVCFVNCGWFDISKKTECKSCGWRRFCCVVGKEKLLGSRYSPNTYALMRSDLAEAGLRKWSPRIQIPGEATFPNALNPSICSVIRGIS